MEATVNPEERQSWLAKRRGCVTASQFHMIMHGRAKSWRNYLARLTAEQCGEVFPEVGAVATNWGHEKEPEAIDEFSEKTGLEVWHEPGFFLHADLPQVGCSPDGLIAEGPTGVEIKCPYKPRIHIEYRAACVVPQKHVAQVQGTMWVLGYDHYYFASYDARNKDLFVLRVDRDNQYIAKLESRIGMFLELLNSGGAVPDRLDPMRMEA